MLLYFAKIFALIQLPSASLRESNSRVIACAGFRVCFSIGIGMHGEALGGTRFVNDALKQTADRGVRERSFVVLLRIPQNFLFAVRLIERQIGLLLQLADFQRALGTFG